MRLDQWLDFAYRALLDADIDVDDAQLEPKVIAQVVLQINSAQLMLRARETLTESELSLLSSALRRREQREPLSQVLGEWEFWSLPFTVSSDTLTPRPDTEVLVEEVLGWLKRSPLAVDGAWVVDVGTGTGCIGLSLASEAPYLEYLLTDLSLEALKVARCNFEELRSRGEIPLETVVRFAHADLLKGLPSGLLASGEPVAIVSNPPYIRRAVAGELAPEVVDHEPHIALFGADDDGLGEVRRLAREAVEVLPMGGGLFLEIGYDQSSQTAEILTEAGFESVKVRHDYSGLPRVVQGFKATT